MTAYDVVIIGLGGHGSSIAYQCARRGLRVLGLEQFDIGHAKGSSHGVHRLFRLGYAEGTAYMPLLARGLELWRDLERESHERLFVRSGVLSASPAGIGRVEEARRNAAAFGIAHEILDHADVNKRFPAFNLAPGMAALLQPDSGFVLCERTIAVQTMLAAAQGADLRARVRVHSIAQQGDHVVVATSAGIFQAGQAVIAAGAWVDKIAPGLDGLHRVGRRAQGFFTPLRPADFSPVACPGFMADDGAGLSIYGFPIYGFPGVKIGRHGHLNEFGDADTLSRETSAADEECLREGLRAFLREADGPCLRLQACLITYTPDEHFIIDTIPGQPQIHVVSMCSGHGFKFATVAGEIVADRLQRRSDRFDLSAFRLSRFAPLQGSARLFQKPNVPPACD